MDSNPFFFCKSNTLVVRFNCTQKKRKKEEKDFCSVWFWIQACIPSLKARPGHIEYQHYINFGTSFFCCCHSRSKTPVTKRTRVCKYD